MVRAEFFKKDGGLIGFRIRGHAGYAGAGDDIVCASVSSAVQFSSNLITEGFHIPAEVKALDNEISLRLSDFPHKNAVTVLEGLLMHFQLLAEDYEGTIKITFSEV